MQTDSYWNVPLLDAPHECVMTEQSMGDILQGILR